MEYKADTLIGSGFKKHVIFLISYLKKTFNGLFPYLQISTNGEFLLINYDHLSISS